MASSTSPFSPVSRLASASAAVFASSVAAAAGATSPAASTAGATPPAASTAGATPPAASTAGATSPAASTAGAISPAASTAGGGAGGAAARLDPLNSLALTELKKKSNPTNTIISYYSDRHCRAGHKFLVPKKDGVYMIDFTPDTYRSYPFLHKDNSDFTDEEIKGEDKKNENAYFLAEKDEKSPGCLRVHINLRAISLPPEIMKLQKIADFLNKHCAVPNIHWKIQKTTDKKVVGFVTTQFFGLRLPGVEQSSTCITRFLSTFPDLAINKGLDDTLIHLFLNSLRKIPCDSIKNHEAANYLMFFEDSNLLNRLTLFIENPENYKECARRAIKGMHTERTAGVENLLASFFDLKMIVNVARTCRGAWKGASTGIEIDNKKRTDIRPGIAAPAALDSAASPSGLPPLPRLPLTAPTTAASSARPASVRRCGIM